MKRMSLGMKLGKKGKWCVFHDYKATMVVKFNGEVSSTLTGQNKTRTKEIDHKMKKQFVKYENQ